MSSLDDSYFGLRNLALTVRATDIGLPSSSAVHAALLEINMGRATVTLACFATGDASLYFSTGGGTIGGRQIPAVRDAAIRLVRLVEAKREILTPVDEVAMPNDNRFNVVALTSGGPRVAIGTVESADKETTPLAEMFRAGQEVITAFRESDWR